MEYEGYLTRDELLERVKSAFPFVIKPAENELYVFDESDLMRRVINSKLSLYEEAELPYEGVILLYDEFSTISQKAVQWMFPSMLRIILTKGDKSGYLHWYLPTYFEKLEFSNPRSAYNFLWLSRDQLSVLSCVFEYIAEEYGELTGYAQERLRDIEKQL